MRNNGNHSPRICKRCLIEFDPASPRQIYCRECGKLNKEENKTQWKLKNGRAYMREYMKSYRRINPLATLLFFFILSGISHAESWLEYKKANGL